MAEDTLTDIEVQLTGTDGNAFALLSKVKRALRENGRQDLVDPFLKDAMSGDYQNLLRVCTRYVIVL